jgi:hypothetical protein
MKTILLTGVLALSAVVGGCVTHEKEVVEKPAPVVVTPPPAPPPKVEVVVPAQ